MLTIEQQACNYQTFRHIERVRNLLNIIIQDLLRRAEEHDQSKLESPEVELFTEYTPKLAASVYGSPEYNELKEKMQVALDHHYAHNSHHPEFWPKGIRGMTLMDVIEMIVDWKAASERHQTGNILKSIEINKMRFNIGPELEDILLNTAIWLNKQ